MPTTGVRFSIAKHAAWAPGLTTPSAWADWARAPYPIQGDGEPGVKAMPAMLRRRASVLGKMALEVAYQCLEGRQDVPTIFCSRHGDVQRAVDMLTDLAQGEALSPTAFSMAVHNATAGLLTIARAERANHMALVAGAATIEHAVIDACGQLADGAPAVLLVASDCPLPQLFTGFEDCAEQAHAWAWLMVPAGDDALSLHWNACDASPADDDQIDLPGSLAVLRFQLAGAASMERLAERRRWRWSRDG